MIRARIFALAVALWATLLVPSSDAGPPSQSPNDCVIVAVEMQRAVRSAARLRKIDVWARVICVRYAGQGMGHALTVFQPGNRICVYDADFGTAELKTTSHDPNVIARELGRHRAQAIVSGRFLEEGRASARP